MKIARCGGAIYVTIQKLTVLGCDPV